MTDQDPIILTASLCPVNPKKKEMEEAKINDFKIPSIILSYWQIGKIQARYWVLNWIGFTHFYKPLDFLWPLLIFTED